MRKGVIISTTGMVCVACGDCVIFQIGQKEEAPVKKRIKEYRLAQKGRRVSKLKISSAIMSEAYSTY